jgi:periplasmic divalent cation tolerance protein
MIKQELWLIYSTFATKEEALSVARILVQNRLAACVNVQENITSIYRWQGAVAQENEVILSAKTVKEKVQPAMDQINAQHSYQIPCIVAVPVSLATPDFMQWVYDETK